MKHFQWVLRRVIENVFNKITNYVRNVLSDSGQLQRRIMLYVVSIEFILRHFLGAFGAENRHMYPALDIFRHFLKRKA